MGECNGSVIMRAGNGLMVDARGYDWNNDIAWQVRGNALDFNGVPGLRARRPDAHNLVLLDRFDHDVLYVLYLIRMAGGRRGRGRGAGRPRGGGGGARGGGG